MNRPATLRAIMAGVADREPFKVGRASVDPVSRDASWPGGQERLQPQTLKVLVTLVSRRGDVVTRDELVQLCWDGRIVGDDVINRSISLLRHFAERAGGFAIETVPRTGYRLVEPGRRANRIPLLAGAAAIAVGLGASGFLYFHAVAQRSITLRLGGFEILSSSVSSEFRDSTRDELINALSNDDVVSVSTATTVPASLGSTYALDGSIGSDGKRTRVILRLLDEHSGITVWTDSTDYPHDEASRIPRLNAVHASTVLRCGMFGASTYGQPLPEKVFSEFMRFCDNSGDFGADPGKALLSAQKIVAGVPNFSWGWSAIALAAVRGLYGPSNSNLADPEKLRQLGLSAAQKALRLDPTNSEALAQEALLIDPDDRVRQLQLIERAASVRPLECGCEHTVYGTILQNAGQLGAAADQFRRTTELLPLSAVGQFGLADTLIASGRNDEAKQHLHAAFELAPDPAFALVNTVMEAPDSKDYGAAIKALRDPRLSISASQRRVFLQSFDVLSTGNSTGIRPTVRALVSLPSSDWDYLVVRLLGAMGANQEALRAFEMRPERRMNDWPSLLWYPSMRGSRDDPNFAKIVSNLGLIAYWRGTGSRPDACRSAPQPPFCRAI